MSKHNKQGPFKQWWTTLFGSEPTEVRGQISEANFMHDEELMLQWLGRFDFDGMPEEWQQTSILKEWMLKTLFYEGHFIITDTSIGVVPLRCGFTGRNPWNYPTECTVTNPVLGDFRRTIDVDCALIHMKPGFGGFVPIANKYSYLLSECDSSIAVNLLNCKSTFIGEAEDVTQARELEKMYDNIASGKPMTIIKNGMGSNFWLTKPKENFIAEMVHDLKQDIRNEWLSLWGIQNTNTKKERMITSEVEANNDQNEFNISHILRTVNDDLKVANDMFGLNLSFKTVDPKGEEDGQTTKETDQPPESGGEGEQS